ncbi:D-aspartate oxidase [Schistosoma japonicum]|uniref:D-aspartate oxidase n=1 Tax=Schistosoma japonicum TaxID=6182 RepID=A0A4Z2D2U2_SCHJA|nr:D-aspartate oxidase [Schistosoma japonicum]
MKVGIIGSGIVGLSTALAIKENYPNLEVIIQADKKGENVTSYGAAGIFRPDPKLLPGCDYNQNELNSNCSFIHWCNIGREHYWKLARSSMSANAGVYFHPTYQLSENYESDIPFVSKLCGKTMFLDEDEIHSIGFGEHIKSAYYYTTCIVEPRYHMNYLLNEFTKLVNNNHLIYSKNVSKFQSADELYTWAKMENIDIIINCTGLSSGYLFNDPEVKPVKGQLVRVFAPWMKFGFYFGRDDTYCYTGKESVILGGFRESLPPVISRPVTDDDIMISPESTKHILQRIDNTWHGGLSKSPVIEEWTGLRPFRPSIRLEIDSYRPEISCQPLPIIHNYGHGSMGVALSWGTAKDTVKLMEQVFKSSRSSQS